MVNVPSETEKPTHLNLRFDMYDSKSHPIDTKYTHQRKTSLRLDTLGASRVAEFGPNSGRTMERLSSITTQPRRSATSIAPSMLTARR